MINIKSDFFLYVALFILGCLLLYILNDLYNLSKPKKISEIHQTSTRVQTSNFTMSKSYGSWKPLKVIGHY